VSSFGTDGAATSAFGAGRTWTAIDGSEFLAVRLIP
jgi:hypothetical protein